MTLARLHPIRNAARAATYLGYLLRPRSPADDLYPFDVPSGVIPGPDPDRVVVLGEATAIGYGVLTHELGLAGQFARRLARSTGRGVEWSAHGIRDSRLRHAPELIAAISATLEHTDYVVLMAGIVDTLSLTTRAAWRRDLAATLDALLMHLPMDARVVIAEAPPLGRAAIISPLERLASTSQVRALNGVSRSVVADRPRCETVAFPDDLHQEMWSTRPLPASYAAMYGKWAAALAQAPGVKNRDGVAEPR